MAEYTKKEKAAEEGNKLFYDTFKHLTTLSTGSILILVALLERLFVNPQWKILVVISLVSFILSILGSILMMFTLAAAVISMKGEKGVTEENIGYFGALACFLIGITAFVAFAIKNFYH